MSKPVQNALQLVKAAKEAVNRELQGTEFVNQLLTINTNFDRMAQLLVFMGAIETPSSDANAAGSGRRFPPITNFMGREIRKHEKEAKVEIPATDEGKKKFRADVEELLNTIGDIDEEALLQKYRGTPYEVILRGVAKVANMDGFANRPIDSAFIAEVKDRAAKVLEERDAKVKLDSNPPSGEVDEDPNEGGDVGTPKEPEVSEPEAKKPSAGKKKERGTKK